MEKFDPRIPAPVSDIGEPVTCAGCGASPEKAHPDSDGWFCDPCHQDRLARFAEEAEAFARRKCRVMGRLQRYDPGSGFRCSPDDYAAGDRESHTENSVACHNRHRCTNYGELTRPLDRDSVRGRAYYAAIRERIDQLLEARMGEDELRRQEAEDEELFGDGG